MRDQTTKDQLWKVRLTSPAEAMVSPTQPLPKLQLPLPAQVNQVQMTAMLQPLPLKHPLTMHLLQSIAEVASNP